MSNWVEPSKQDWISDKPGSRVRGSKEAMEAAVDYMFTGWRIAELNYAPTVSGILAHYYGVNLAHLGLALMELNEGGQDV